ncbi:low affinity immunoglobulin gamma Fc region receptor III-A-like isoform X2 [Pteronotus mesoamericanus]|uniref:low affinity immunoglobulin gamma Fc region receptor III-A-like isoform X2 n=1 Tax=Pteronotus mesoamericanus TaxID=1884717 RepID=UPI0023EC6CC9|nr:low affinity immunoglobulin gamma Fc region receptor III-A-like isoform X2 [Pteronotus parnellii mesoamericanus]
MWPLRLLTALLLLEDHPKAVVTLDPEWDRVLRDDKVTLKCQGSHTEDGPTQWWHKEHLLPSQAPSYSIESAKVNDSGEYSCQSPGTQRSDPVRLQVHAVWLLLQARHWVVQVGDSIRLRCHTWKNFPIYKVQYFQDGVGKQYTYQYSDFYIEKATAAHNGSYFCRGLIDNRRNESSEAVYVTVQGLRPLTSVPAPFGRLVTISLAVGLLFVLDTGLYFSVWKDLQSLLKKREEGGHMK